MLNQFEAVVAELHKQCVEDAEKKSMRSRMITHVVHASVYSIAYNMERFKCYVEIYENGFAWKLERFQREFGEVMLRTLAQTLLDDDWDILGPEICIKRRWNGVSRLALAVTARRMGKSVAVARSEASLVESILRYPLKTKKRFRSTIFSPGKRQSQGLAEYVKDHFSERGLTRYQIVANEEKLEFSMDSSDPDAPTVKVYIYPSNPKISLSFSISLSLSLSENIFFGSGGVY